LESFNCWKKGHIKANCWAKCGGKEGQGPRQRQGNTQANAAAVSEKPEDKSWAAIKVIDMGDDIATMAVAATSAACIDKQVYTILYNSGASQHMTPH
jgi:hypothetical protein